MNRRWFLIASGDMALYRRRIAAEDWTPVGVEALDANAFDVVRSTENRSVIAGPGAGKTELLATSARFQRVLG